MRYPPVKTLDAVAQGRIDYRARRDATHFRHFFRTLDDQGNPSSDPQTIARVELTQRGKDYYTQLNGRSR